MPESAVRPHPQPAQRAATGPHLMVRYWKRMHANKVYPIVVSTSGKGDADPVVVRVVMAGAQVVPAEQTMDPSNPGEKATFYVTPLARGSLRGERVEVLQNGRKIQEIRIPSKVVSQRGTLVWLILAIAVPWLILHFFQYSPIGFQAPLDPKTGTEEYVRSPWMRYKDDKDKDDQLNGPKRITNFVTDNTPKLEPLLDKDSDIVDYYKKAQDFPRTAYQHLIRNYHDLDQPLAFYLFCAFMLITLISFVARQEGRKTAYGKPLPSVAAEE